MTWVRLLTILAALGMLSAAAPAWSFAYTTYSGQGDPLENATSGMPVVWHDKTATMSPDFETLFHDSAVIAMSAWSEAGGAFKWRVGTAAAGPCNHYDMFNSASWRRVQCDGSGFGDAVAFTSRVYAEMGGVWYLADADIVFDQSRAWMPYYSGSLQRSTAGNETVYDFRRVMVHELGHALGLDHPDEAGQKVDAIMNSRTSDIDALQADDVLGLKTLYPVASAGADSASSEIQGVGEDDPGGGGGAGLGLMPLLMWMLGRRRFSASRPRSGHRRGGVG